MSMHLHPLDLPSHLCGVSVLTLSLLLEHPMDVTCVLWSLLLFLQLRTTPAAGGNGHFTDCLYCIDSQDGGCGVTCAYEAARDTWPYFI